MKPPNNSIYDFKPVYLLAVFSFIYLTIAYLNNEYLFNKDLFYNSLGAKLSADRIDAIFTNQVKFQWVGYLAVPVIVFLKVVLVAACIYTGIILGNREASFNDVLKIVLLAEIVMVLSAFFKVTCLLYKGVDSFDDIRSFSPLSLLQLINVRSIPSYAVYPIQTLNLFELGYWIVLALGLRHFLQLPFAKSLVMVLTTYGIGLCIWMLAVVFIQVQLN